MSSVSCPSLEQLSAVQFLVCKKLALIAMAALSRACNSDSLTRSYYIRPSMESKKRPRKLSR